MTAKTDAQLDDNEVAEPAASAPATAATAGARLAARKAAKAARKAAERGKNNIMADAVQEQAVVASNWFEQNSRVLLLTVGGLCVLGAAWVGFQSVTHKKASEAAAALADGVKVSLAAVVSGDAVAEDEASDEETFATAKARSEKALTSYQAVVKNHAGTDAALWARLGEGSELLSLGKADDAGRAFGAVATAAEDDFLRYRALEGQGFALEAQNKLDEATQKFADIAKLANGAYKPASDFHLARLLAARGDHKGAKDMFSKLVDTLGEQALEKGESFTAIRDEAQIRLTELGGEKKARPGVGGPNVGAEGLTPELLESLKRQLEQKAPAAPEGP